MERIISACYFQKRFVKTGFSVQMRVTTEEIAEATGELCRLLSKDDQVFDYFAGTNYLKEAIDRLVASAGIQVKNHGCLSRFSSEGQELSAMTSYLLVNGNLYDHKLCCIEKMHNVWCFDR